MSIIYPFIGVVIAIIIAIIVYVLNSSKRIVDKTKDWKVGDLLLLNPIFDKLLKNANQKYGELRGWDENHVYIRIGNGVTQYDYNVIDFNKSLTWRQNYDSCEKFMKGQKPAFKGNIEQEEYCDGDGTVDEKIHGKYISELTETECQVYLKECVENEWYEKAEMIKKQMEKYR
jgi:hypothetical protein